LPESLADASVCGVGSLAFALDSAKLSPGNQERLAHATPCLLEQLASATLSIAANGDALGSEAYQQALAQRRAASIHGFLLARGLPDDRLRVLEEPVGEPRSAQLKLTPST
jgi:outer membrane protein OmpA-like peptidoglycan-associated protein